MSDDLISRKSLLECAEYDDKGRLVIPYRKVKNAPTAFDKEKVIEELRSEASRWHESGVEFKDENEKGVAAGFRLATHIVEKGGIE
ncbi:hypothetical protein [[Ruminococcus] torques]|uniref:hypothetical protein n=1 Tax=[Ruminococcus] torques TaxID=33039 RepID=UPI0025A32B5E|nr:hypothetical protein [[Ruminococcus] torques]MDM8237114.1 hypothetical protein [[Ruminococcus] torques]